MLGILVGRNADAIAANFPSVWRRRAPATIAPDFGFLPDGRRRRGAIGLLVALCVAQVGSLFSSDAWNNITFTAGEVKDPRRNIPLSLAYGTLLVTVLYVLANVAYLCTLPLSSRSARRPTTASRPPRSRRMFGPAGAAIMAVAIVISTFGCNNGLILAGARVYYAMAKDGLFFTPHRRAQRAPRAGVRPRAAVHLGLPAPAAAHPARATPRAPSGRCDAGEAVYGNLYGKLLDWVVFAVLIFYVLTIVGLFVLRRKRPDAERPYRAFGYPFVPRSTSWRRLDDRAGAAALPAPRPAWPGLRHRAHRRAVYAALAASGRPDQRPFGGNTDVPDPYQADRPAARRGRRDRRARAQAHARALALWSRSGIGAIIGAGLFVRTAAAIADRSGPSVVLAFIVAGVGCAFAGLCYAEFASMIPIAGSAYTYSYATMGELLAWIIGWDLVLEYAVGAATVAIAWSEYFNRVLGFFGLHIPYEWCHSPLETMADQPRASQRHHEPAGDRHPAAPHRCCWCAARRSRPSSTT